MEGKESVMESVHTKKDDFNEMLQVPLNNEPNAQDSEELSRRQQKRVRRACIYCNRSHMSCENVRPCKRCVQRGIAHLCKDSETPRRRGRKGAYLEDSRFVPLTSEDGK